MKIINISGIEQLLTTHSETTLEKNFLSRIYQCE